jgi:hypothetical protein
MFQKVRCEQGERVEVGVVSLDAESKWVDMHGAQSGGLCAAHVVANGITYVDALRRARFECRECQIEYTWIGLLDSYDL